MHVDVAPDPAASAARWLARRVRAAVAERGRAAVALSGGSTAPALIAAVSDPAVAGVVPWPAVTVWQVDERVAPAGDPARNAGQLDPLPCRVLPMPVTAADLRAAARRYAAGLPDRFDVVHLGLGVDGHTASWPPGRPDIVGSDRAVELVDEFNGLPRMTLTGRVVNSARARFVLAAGPDKRDMVERFLLGDAALPITAVRRTGTRLFLDPAASPGAPGG